MCYCFVVLLEALQSPVPVSKVLLETLDPTLSLNPNKLCLQGHLIPGAYKFDALITTFEMVLSDCPELREISWRCVIIDEAHRLKNRNCKLLDSLKMLDLVRKLQMTVLSAYSSACLLTVVLWFPAGTQGAVDRHSSSEHRGRTLQSASFPRACSVPL